MSELARPAAAAGETATATRSGDAQADERLFEELERTEAYLHREGCGDGAAAVRKAIRRLRAAGATEHRHAS